MSSGNKGRIPHFGTEAILTLVFYMLAVTSVISYFVWRDEYPQSFVVLGIAAIVVRIAFYLYRFFVNKK